MVYPRYSEIHPSYAAALEQLFPSYACQIAHPEPHKDYFKGHSSSEAPMNKEAYADKLGTAIHEAAHIVFTLLVSSSDFPIFMKCAEISYEVSSDKDYIYYTGWGGFVRFTETPQKHILKTLIDDAGVAALDVFGFGKPGLGAESDMKNETENRLLHTKRIGGVDRAVSWTHQKHEYRSYMKQEKETLYLYTKQIAEENKGAIVAFASALYDKKQLSGEEIYQIAEYTPIERKTYNNLLRYIEAFYS